MANWDNASAMLNLCLCPVAYAWYWRMVGRVPEFAHYTHTCLARRKQLVSGKTCMVTWLEYTSTIGQILVPIWYQVLCNGNIVKSCLLTHACSKCTDTLHVRKFVKRQVHVLIHSSYFCAQCDVHSSLILKYIGPNAIHQTLYTSNSKPLLYLAHVMCVLSVLTHYTWYEM